MRVSIPAKLVGVAVIVIASVVVTAAYGPVNNPDLTDNYNTHHHTGGGWWNGLRNAFHDMNPFGHRLGHDWSETHSRVERIYEDMHRQAQQRVNDLRDEIAYKDYKDLQNKIADIYADAALEAEQRIEKLKRPLFGALWRSYGKQDEDVDEETAYQRYLAMARSKVGEAGDAIKKKFSGKPVHEATQIFDETSKTVGDAYRHAVEKAKEAASKVAPMAGEAWHDTKARASKVYDDMLHLTRRDTRPLFVRMGEGLRNGMWRAGHAAEYAAVKTWHLFLHLAMGSVWMVLGGILATVGMNQWEKYIFRKQLSSPQTGPAVLAKEFWVAGGSDYQRKFIDYWTHTAAPWIKGQPGVKWMRFGQGLDIGSNVYQVATEFDTMENLRRFVKSPELNELKKRMPKATLSRHHIGRMLHQQKGPAFQSTDMLEGSTTGSGFGSEGLRQRGATLTAGGPGH